MLFNVFSPLHLPHTLYCCSHCRIKHTIMLVEQAQTNKHRVFLCAITVTQVLVIRGSTYQQENRFRHNTRVFSVEWIPVSSLWFYLGCYHLPFSPSLPPTSVGFLLKLVNRENNATSYFACAVVDALPLCHNLSFIFVWKRFIGDQSLSRWWLFFLQPLHCNQYLLQNDELKLKVCLLPVNGRINIVDWKQETHHSSLCWMANSVLVFLKSISNPLFCAQMHLEREANMRPQLVVLS